MTNLEWPAPSGPRTNPRIHPHAGQWLVLLRPLGLALALAGAGYAQSLADARQQTGRALAFYLVAALLFALCTWQRPSDERPSRASSTPVVHWKWLAWVLLFAALAYASLGGNQLTLQGALPWVLAVVLCFPALPAPPTSDRTPATRSKPAAHAWHMSWQTLALLGAMLVGAWLRLYHLQTLPADLGWDLPYNYYDVQRILDGERLIFFPANMGREGLFFYLAAGVARLGSLSPYSIRITSALVGVAAIPAIYLLARECLDREAGLYAAWLLALNKWHLVLSRSGYRVSLMPLLSILALYGLARGLRRGSARDWLWCGLFTGLGLWSYKAFVFMLPLVLACVLLYALFGLGRRGAPAPGASEPESDTHWTPGPRALLRGCAIWLLVTAITCVPLVRYAIDEPGTYLTRELLAQEIVAESAEGASRWALLGENAVTSLLMFNYVGDGNSRFGVPFQRHMGYMSGILLVFGLAVALASPRRRGHALLGVALLGLLVPMTVTMVAHETPNCFRSSGTIGPAVALGALALRRIRSLLTQALAPLRGQRLRLALQAEGARSRTVGLPVGTSLALLIPLVIGLFVLAEWRETERFYFHDFRQYAPDQANYSTALEISKAVGAYAEGPVYAKVWPHWYDGRALAVHLSAAGRPTPVEIVTLQADQPPLTDVYGSALFVLHPDDIDALRVLEGAFARVAPVAQHYPDGRAAFVLVYVQR